MSLSSTTRVSICSQVAVLLEDRPFSSFDPTNAVASACNAVYDRMVNTALSNSEWRFAMRPAGLQLITTRDNIMATTLAENEHPRYRNAYALPVDYLHLHEVASPIPADGYEILGHRFYANADSVNIIYIHRPDEALFTNAFTTYLQYLIASEIALAITGVRGTATYYAEKAEVALLDALREDNRNETPQKLVSRRSIVDYNVRNLYSYGY